MIKKLIATLVAIALALPVYAESVSKIASAGGDITEILFELALAKKWPLSIQRLSSPKL